MTILDHRNPYCPFLAFILIVGVDQILKFNAVLGFHFYLNRSWFLGLLPGNQLAIVLSILLSIGLIVLIRKKILGSLLVSIILAGLFSNIIDRAIYGGVVDNFNFGYKYWGNLSDIAILVGLGYLIIEKVVLKSKKPE